MKKILIFGCSKNAIKIQQIISEMPDYNLVGFVDNDTEKWGRKYLDRIVLSPIEMEEYCQDVNTYILIGNFHYEETYFQVIQMIGMERIYLNLDEFLLANRNALGEIGRKVLCASGYGLDLNKENNYLLICNMGLPSEEALYRQAFVFQRLVAYRHSGMKIDAYGLVKGEKSKKYVYSGTEIYEGDIVEFRNLLRQRKYKKILVHFMDESIYFHLNCVYEKAFPKLIVWSHGCDILKWNRRRFNYTQTDIEKNSSVYERKWEDKAALWAKIFQREDVNCIFVSQWLKEISEHDIGKRPFRWEIIPNYVNDQLFPYVEKKPDMRMKVLLIKSHKSRMYANDIAAKVILELSQRVFFDELSFSLYGDGKLFEENFEELQERNFKNVEINKSYLKQNEIAQLHKEYGIFLCPTRQDTQGVSMCEAMSSGMVVVTNAVAAVSEYIDDSCGMLCGDEDYVQMADAIEYLYHNSDAFLEKSRHAAQRVRRQCGYGQTIQRELDLILD